VLLIRFLALLSLWQPVFRPERSFQRALRQAMGALLVVGSATLTRILASLGRDQQDWSADYKLQWGWRFLQASLLLPLHRKHNVNARAIPVRFVMAPSLKKPGAKATLQEPTHFREQRKPYNLSQQSVSLLIG
jgi:hypothetical protein